MLAVGTCYEHYNAVWVKNEWSRYLKIISQDKNKYLIPCYKNIDAYDMPKEFAHLQGQDMGKVGAIQDLLRGVEKILPKQKNTTVIQQTVVAPPQTSAPGVASLLERAFMFLEDGDWQGADEYCEKVLDIDPENARAYLGKLMAELKVKKQDALKNCAQPFDTSRNYQKVLRFGDEAMKSAVQGYVKHIKDRNEENRLNGLYQKAKSAMDAAKTEGAYKEAARLFENIHSYRDSADLVKKCRELAENARKDYILSRAKAKMKQGITAEWEEAIRMFQTVPGWKDADACVIECEELIRKAEIARKDEILARGKAKMCGFVGACSEAIKLFQSIPGWKDADEMITVCRKQIAELEAQEEARRIEKERREEEERLERERKAEIQLREALAAKKRRERITIAVSVIVLLAVAAYFAATLYIPEMHYKEAAELMATGDYDAAISAFAFGKAVGYKDAWEKSLELWKQCGRVVSISSGVSHTVGLKADGTVVAVGSNKKGQCNVSDWKGIVVISAGANHTVGLKADGTVVAVGRNDDGQCNVSEWTNIVAISTGEYHTVGLKADGTVVAISYKFYGQCDVSDWTDIVAISADASHTIGLRADGTVMAVGRNDDGQCDVSDWTDIVAISAGANHTVGLKADGTVVAVGRNDGGQCNVSEWTNIVAISTGDYHTVGLKADGTVVAVGYKFHGRCDVSDWTDIVAISAGANHTVGLKADGTVVAVGYNGFGQCDVSDWENILVP